MSIMIKLKYSFWSFFYWLNAIKLSLIGCSKIQLGSCVIYKDKEWMVSNGVISNSWLLRDQRGHSVEAPSKECKRVKSIKEWIHAYRFMYRWYMTSWHRIYIEKRMYK